ncbi:histidine phosphatase family protein [Azonexus sp.]|uniref:histidine phosphatase family protein n=1 Tax=Azonexus sp. TaxID=1872668 RepID=UPI0035AF0AB3
MAALTLHLVRHPRPLIAPGVCYGQLDVAAEDPAPIVACLRCELPPGLPVWSSPLQRCRTLAEALQPAPRLDARLMELNFGAWEGRPWDDIARPELDAWAVDIDGYAPPGGESPRQLQQRVLAFVDELPAGAHLLVTHAGVIRALLAAAAGETLAAVLNRPAPAYGSLTSLDYSSGSR